MVLTNFCVCGNLSGEFTLAHNVCSLDFDEILGMLLQIGNIAKVPSAAIVVIWYV